MTFDSPDPVRAAGAGNLCCGAASLSLFYPTLMSCTFCIPASFDLYTIPCMYAAWIASSSLRGSVLPLQTPTYCLSSHQIRLAQPRPSNPENVEFCPGSIKEIQRLSIPYTLTSNQVDLI